MEAEIAAGERNQRESSVERYHGQGGRDAGGHRRGEERRRLPVSGDLVADRDDRDPVISPTDTAHRALHSGGLARGAINTRTHHGSSKPLEVFVTRDKNEAINSYISDMLALEDHIEKAIRSQLEDLKDYPDVVTELRQIHRKVEHHISDLRGLSARRGAGGVKEAVKRAGSAVLGAAAGVIDLVRTEGLPKNLRDDYTALSLASIGYVMLHTTGLSLDDGEVAELARQGFTDYAGAVSRLQAAIPAAVVAFLKQDGLAAREDVVPQIRRTIEEVWQAQSSGVFQSDETVVSRDTQR
jgi:hypothetical protein